MKKEVHVSITKFYGHGGKHFHMRLQVIELLPDEDFDQRLEMHEHKANTQRSVKRQLHKWQYEYGKLIINDPERSGDPKWLYRPGD